MINIISVIVLGAWIITKTITDTIVELKKIKINNIKED